MKFWSWLLVAALSIYSAQAALHQDGYCAMYDNCGKKLVFGQQLPCAMTTKAVTPDKESISLLHELCGPEFPTESVCCALDQLKAMQSSLKRVDPIISSCPACRKNFYDFVCDFLCLPNQSTFINVTKTAISNTKKEIVSELTQYVDPEYAEAFFDSCKEVKFSATNGYAMDLIGGGAKNYSQFLKFLGDEKPLLGGSPFQINYVYETIKEEADSGLQVRHGDMKACDNPDWKCACSDCSTSCPKLPKFRNFEKKCKVGPLPCFSFFIIIVWICIILLIAGYKVYLAKSSIRLEDPNEGVYNHLNLTDLKSVFDILHKVHRKFSLKIDDSFGLLAFTFANNPKLTITVSILFAVVFSLGNYWLKLETDPIKLWVSPSEPAMKNMEYFENNFGEWYRIEQIIVSTPDDSPILSLPIMHWWFEEEAKLQSLNKHVSLDDLCLKPTGESCAIQSFTQYYWGDASRIDDQNWKRDLKACTDSPVNCLPQFQQPLSPSLLFDNADPLKATAFTVTLLLNNNKTNNHYSNLAIDYEHLIQEWVTELKNDNPHLNIDYSTENSLTEELNKSTNTDFKVVLISYLTMFLYASIALSGKLPTSKISSFIKTRFGLALSGIFIVLISVTSSAGLFSMLGLKSTLIIAEVIPFLILAIGIDNIFLLVHELEVVTESSPNLPVEFRVSEAVRRVGPSCFTSAIVQFSMFLLATSVDMPAVKNFAYYSAGAIAFNIVFQMTGFVSILTLDQKRLESNRIDILAWIKVNDAQDDAAIKFDFTQLIRDYFAPFILTPSVKPKILSVFLLWLGVSLSLLPQIELGLDQRIALPADSYLIDYFNSLYKYFDAGPPVFYIVKDLDVTIRENQQKICGKFSTCDEFSLANILEQEYKRGGKSTIIQPSTNWLDDFLTWLNPNLDQCCRVQKRDNNVFCSPYAPERQCDTCYEDKPYDANMNGFPENESFMKYFSHWIEEPSDPCPLGGKAPYGTSINWNTTGISASYFRTSHKPLKSQSDFITAYKNSLRIIDEIKQFQPELDVISFSPFYVYFVQYETIVKLTFVLLSIASVIIWVLTTLLLGSVRSATVLLVVILFIMTNIGGVLSLWEINLNAVSLVNLIICIGLAVEFTIHITRAYTVNRIENEHQLFHNFMSNDLIKKSYAEIRQKKAFSALVSVGGAELGGITLTKFIGVFILGFTKSKIFEVYYFRMWLSLVFIAAIHAFCLLPVLLSYFGDDREIKGHNGGIEEDF